MFNGKTNFLKNIEKLLAAMIELIVVAKTV